jgi:hypothetical protein
MFLLIYRDYTCKEKKEGKMGVDERTVTYLQLEEAAQLAIDQQELTQSDVNIFFANLLKVLANSNAGGQNRSSI